MLVCWQQDSDAARSPKAQQRKRRSGATSVELSISLRIPWVSRAQQAHYPLSWEERLARNARAPSAGRVTILLFGVPAAFAVFLGIQAI